MKKILITGASGALGQTFLSYFDGCETVQVVTAGRTSVKNVTHHYLDLLNEKNITDVLEQVQPDYIFHLAATFSKELEEAYKINVRSTQIILDYVLKKSPQTVVTLIGSAAEYGAVSEKNNPIVESQALNPMTPYGVSKAWQSQLIYRYHSLGVQVRLARIFNLFGSGLSRNSFAGDLEYQIQQVKTGKQKTINIGIVDTIRDYISLQDAVIQILQIAQFGESGEVYHVASGKAERTRNFVCRRLRECGININLLNENSYNFMSKHKPLREVSASIDKTRKIFKNARLF